MCFVVNMIQAIVSNGKIQIQAPTELHDGETVSVIVLNHCVADAPLTSEEIVNSLRILDDFVTNFPVLENGEDLSAASRSAGEIEKQDFSTNAENLRRLFD